MGTGAMPWFAHSTRELNPAVQHFESIDWLKWGPRYCYHSMSTLSKRTAGVFA